MDKNVIWVDEDDNELGEISIEKAHNEKLLHRISVVYLTNDEGSILVQKRTDDGRLDHSAAGHVDVGESYLEAAKRELEEELGVSNVELKEIGDCNPNKNSLKQHRFRVFQCKANPGKLDPSEVAEVFWADPQEIWIDMQNDSENKKYCGGFKASLKLFLENRT